MKIFWHISQEDMDEDWVELPQPVFNRAIKDSFFKGFWFGMIFALFLVIVFIIGVHSAKGGQA